MNIVSECLETKIKYQTYKGNRKRLDFENTAMQVSGSFNNLLLVKNEGVIVKT